MKDASLLERFAHSGSRGQVIPLVALMLVVLLGAATLAVDVGYWRYQERLAQSAADSAALAATTELLFPVANDVTTAGKRDATKNGFADDGGVKVSVSVNHPPAAGGYRNDLRAAEVIVSEKQPNFFRPFSAARSG